MTRTGEWLEHYGESHTHRINRVLHWICVPLIVMSLIGLLWSLPVPEEFSRASPALNWGTLFIMAAVVYYFIMSISLAFGILPVVISMVAIVAWVDTLSAPLWLVSAAMFVISWSGQFIGHWFEGEQPPFLQDLQLSMIAPLWLLATIYRRLKIPY